MKKTDTGDATDGEQKPNKTAADLIVTRSIRDLRTHPLNLEIYAGYDPAQELVESILAVGVLEPVAITANNRIVSGHRRVAAAANAGLEHVPVRVVHCGDDLEIERMLKQV